MPRKSKRKTRTDRVNIAVEEFAQTATRWIGSPLSLIVHTFIFIGAFALVFFGVPIDTILLSMTTIVSFEAIYLSIFIQMTVNRQSNILVEVKEDVGDLQEDLEEIQEDVGEIQENIEEIQEDVGEIQEDIEDIQEDVEEIQEDVGDLQEEEIAVTQQDTTPKKSI